VVPQTPRPPGRRRSDPAPGGVVVVVVLVLVRGLGGCKKGTGVLVIYGCKGKVGVFGQYAKGAVITHEVKFPRFIWVISNV